jgi:hypothetical protein
VLSLLLLVPRPLSLLVPRLLLLLLLLLLVVLLSLYPPLRAAR